MFQKVDSTNVGKEEVGTSADEKTTLEWITKVFSADDPCEARSCSKSIVQVGLPKLKVFPGTKSLDSSSIASMSTSPMYSLQARPHSNITQHTKQFDTGRV